MVLPRWPSPFLPIAAAAALPCCGSSAAPRHTSPEASVSQDGAPTPDACSLADAPGAHDSSSDGSREAGTGSPDAPAGDGAAKTCSDGSPIAYRRTSCPGAAPAVPSALATALGGATRGDIVSLHGLDVDGSPCFPVDVCVPTSAATLLFSDEPESPTTDGILYADVVGPGAYRAYVYHVNAGTGLRKFPIVVLNQGTVTVHAVVGPVGIAGPSADYVSVGKQAVAAWMQSAKTTTVDVPAGQRVLLDADLDAVHAANGELAHAILDFTLDGPVKASVVSLLSDEDAVTATGGLSLLANTGEHLRGTFPGADLLLEATPAPASSGATHLDLGGDVTDEPLAGHDYVDGTSVTLLGNYGVPYTIRLRLGGEAALLVAPQGGAWGGAAVLPAGLDGPATTSLLPGASDSLGSQTSAIFGGRYAAGAALDVRLMTAGGSNLPIDVAAVPLP